MNCLNSMSSAEHQPMTRRRKTRRGTKSCWECKRRKVRCSFLTQSSESVCVACRRRGSSCLGQDVPEEQSHAENHVGTPQEHIARVGALLQRFAKDVEKPTSNITWHVSDVVKESGSRERPNGIPSPATTSGTEPTRAQVAPIDSSVPIGANSVPFHVSPSVEYGDHGWITALLMAGLPPPQDLDVLCNPSSQTAVYLYRTNTKPYHVLREEGFEQLSEIRQHLTANAHPVMLAKHILKLAIRLNTIWDRGFQGLSDDCQSLEKRLVWPALRFVTTNDELAGSAEFLECQMLESIYHWNCGNIRRAWAVTRRVLASAQSLGLHRQNYSRLKSLDPNREVCGKYIWSHITYMDSMFSLMLRLPPGISRSDEQKILDLQSESPNAQIERAHTNIALRILDRNEHDAALEDLATLRQIDADILQAAECLPSDFWTYPNLTEENVESDDAFWDVVRMINQVYHHTLVVLLHLPYLLTSRAIGPQDYSKTMCATSSREILMRLGANRVNGIIAPYCRPAHFFILMAAITLTLAHLESHGREPRASVLAHQRFGDRAMIEQVLESMETCGRLSEDVLSAKSAAFLKGLLNAERDTAKGQKYDIAIGEHAEATNEEASHVLRISLPYFGSIRISRENSESRQDSGRASTKDCLVPGQPTTEQPAQETFLPRVPNAPGLRAQSSSVLQEQSANLAATSDEWVFGDVDTVFFESMMSGAADFNVGDHGRFGMDEAWTWTEFK